jgi:hypothetical protein
MLVEATRTPIAGHRRRLYNEITKPLFAGQIANEMVTKMVDRCFAMGPMTETKPTVLRLGL